MVLAESTNIVSKLKVLTLTNLNIEMITEYSGWFYISCPVIWKSLFRSVFVHTES